MPWRKRLLLGAVALAAAILLAAACALAAHGNLLLACVLAGFTVIAATAAVHMYWVRCDLTGRSLRQGRRDARVVALTFDDGPGPDTPAVLEALDLVGARATFFMLGQAAEAYPELVREVARRGHVVATHGYSHRKLHLVRRAVVEDELARGCRAIRDAGVEPVPYFRAPHGFKGPALQRTLKAKRLRLVGWTRGVWDTERPGSETIVARACAAMRGGEILLLHDGCGTPGSKPRRDQTATAVPEIVRRWRIAGYRFVTIDELDDARSGSRLAKTDGEVDGAESPGRHDAAAARLVPGNDTVLDTVPGNDAASREAVRMSQPVPEPLSDTARRDETESGSRSRLLRVMRWGGIAVVIGLGVIAMRKLDFNQLRRAFADADPSVLVAAAFANVLALCAQAARWLAIVRPIERRAKLRDAFFTLVAGYAIGMVVPARASDLARAHLMARRAGMSTATLTATAVVDHVVGSVALFSIIGVLAASSSLPAWLRGAAKIALGGALLLLAVLWLARPREPVATGTRSKHLPIVGRLRSGLLAVSRPAALVAACLMALGGWAAEALIAHLALAAFRLPADIAASALVVLATTLSSAASISPGNTGAFEVACVVALAGLGVGQEAALAFAIGYHAVHLIPTGLIGGAWLVSHGYRMSVLREAG